MPLILPIPPQAAYDALDAGLKPLVASPAVATHLPSALKAVSHAVSGAAAATPQGSSPKLSLRAFALELNSLAENDLGAARATGWQHLLSTGVGHATVLARTAVHHNQHTFAALSESPFASELQDQVASLQTDPQIATGPFEAAVLEVPALHVVAVWLKDTTHHHDLVVPLAPVFPPVVAGHRYTAAEFLSVLRPLARAKLQAADPRSGG